jgi:hypothetical protein
MRDVQHFLTPLAPTYAELIVNNKCADINDPEKSEIY